MKPSSIILHQNLIRLAKGVLKAYEQWFADECLDGMTDRLKEDKRERLDKMKHPV